jgi:hypothetical protein
MIFCTPSIRAIIKADRLIMLESLTEDEPATQEPQGRSPIVDNVMAHIRAFTVKAHHADEQYTPSPFEFTYVPPSPS